MENKFEKHPAYEDDFEGNPKTSEEPKEAKKKAGVTTHKEVLERVAESDAGLIQNTIKDDINNHPEVEKITEKEIEQKIKSAVSRINDSSKELQFSSSPGVRDLQIDSHALCHFFESYSGPNPEDSENFSFLNYPQGLKVAENLLNQHIEDRIKTKKFWCDARIIGPIIRYNLENINNIESFPFRPDCLTKNEYLNIFEDEKKDGGRGEFGNSNLAILFLKSETPKDFIIKTIKAGERLPKIDNNLLIEFFETIKDSVSQEELDMYAAKYCSPNDRSLSANELVENIKGAEQAHSLEKGVFVDVDGTLIIDGELNIDLAKELMVRNDVVIFSGGDPDLKTKQLKELGFPENLLPVVSKDKYKGKILEKLIDDSAPEYQGFDVAFYFKPRKGPSKYLTEAGPGGSEDSELIEINEALNMGIAFIEKFILENKKLVNVLKQRYNIDYEEILKKLKLGEKKKN